MTAYYNEIDPYAAQWLRNLIKEGLIADGEVDTRSIVDVRPGDLVAFKQCHFFAGLGGWAGALRLAGFPDDRPVWTGSCPCQPFSLAGKQKGFADERHLWPIWRELIRERRPAKVYGEQVASASAWLGLVRGDLEALDYAVGAIPIEAASAGADHLRDRFWFVGDDPGERRREGWAEHEVRGRWPAAARDGCVEHANELGAGEGRQQRSGQQRWPGGDQEACPSSHAMADANGSAIWVEPGRSGGPSWAGAREHRDDCEVCLADGEVERRQDRNGGSLQGAVERERQTEQSERRGSDAGIEWVVGADGKARRVKPGIRLLAHGIPARVAKLRALGNAIDLRPAAAFIRASM